MNLVKYLSEFSKKRIAVIGDLMLDNYIFGKVERISPEAPVPIVSVYEERCVPGGAANTANNISSMKGNSFLFGILGEDFAKNNFLESTRKNLINVEGIIISQKKPTIQKTRVIGHNQHLLRIDYENTDLIEGVLEEKIISAVKKIKNLDAIAISDYAKGTVTQKICEEIGKYAFKNKILLIVDPKPKHKEFYRNVSLITPNKKEAEEMTGINLKTEEDIENAGKKLVEEMKCNVLITTGENGMSLFEKNKKPVHLPTVAQEVYDVSGAGDTVTATMSLALSSGASFEESAVLANYAAGIKVGKVGTYPVSFEELEKILLKNA
jgi:rfaE bifunctional protein kinase chain/domain